MQSNFCNLIFYKIKPPFELIWIFFQGFTSSIRMKIRSEKITSQRDPSAESGKFQNKINKLSRTLWQRASGKIPEVIKTGSNNNNMHQTNKKKANINLCGGIDIGASGVIGIVLCMLCASCCSIGGIVHSAYAAALCMVMALCIVLQHCMSLQVALHIVGGRITCCWRWHCMLLEVVLCIVEGDIAYH